MTACKHTYTPDSIHANYETCRGCGTSHSTVAPTPELIYTADYWSHSKNHSTLQEQVFNVESHLENGISKNQFVLNLIDVEDRAAALEIGCAPGSLLKRLKFDAGFNAVSGIEVCAEWENELRCITDSPLSKRNWLHLHFGLFPHVTRDFVNWINFFDLIVSCDCLEHSHEPEEFLAECARLLKPGGQLILMLPLISPNYEMPERMWNSEEHVFLHSVENISAMLYDAGFSVTGREWHQWTAGHECASARKAV